MYKLSIIIPVYNAEKYLSRCLDSVIAQDYQNLEIVIVNDGSTDGSAQICEKYANIDKRIIVYHKENGGAGTARKEALKHVQGDYITCVDADDWIEQDAYDDLMTIANESQPDLLACSFIKEFGELQTERKDYPEEGYYNEKKFHGVIKTAGDKEPFFCQVINASLCCKVMKKSVFERFQKEVPDEIVMGEDLAVVLPMILNINSIYISKKAYYHYCQNKESTTWTWKIGEFDRLKILTDYLKKIGSDNDVSKRLVVQSIYFAMMEVLHDIPDDYFNNKIPFLPRISLNSRLVVYGKGSFASNLIEIINHLKLCTLVLNVDSADAEVLFSLDEEKYDYVVIAILDYMIVDKVKLYLEENNISKEKIVCIDKKDLTLDNLPIELR